LEVEECIEVLHGGGPADLVELSLELSAWMFVLGGRTKTVNEGRELAAEMIATGRARDTFREVIELQGGEVRVVDDPSLLPHARHTAHLPAKRSGFVTAIRCEQVGVASMTLGGGREKKEDSVDPGVGLVLEKKIGDAVQAGESLCTIHYNSEGKLVPATRLLAQSFEIGDNAPAATPLVLKLIGAEKYS
jgi:thymidine phosphorylase